MNTKPLRPRLLTPRLIAEANRIAACLKAFERGDAPDSPVFAGMDADDILRMAKARRKGELKTGIVMDDHVVLITLPWPQIAASSEVALAEVILRLMMEVRAHDERPEQ